MGDGAAVLTGFDALVAEVQGRVRRALTPVAGPDAARQATVDALVHVWANRERVRAMDNPAGYLTASLAAASDLIARSVVSSPMIWPALMANRWSSPAWSGSWLRSPSVSGQAEAVRVRRRRAP